MEVINDIKRLKEIIDSYDSIVFLGGAGTSTESGVPDFRSPDGLYNQPYKYSPEHILSHNFFFNQPEIFYEFYIEKLVSHDPMPNSGHHYLKELEESGKLRAVITQNIDNLHQAAGSKKVIELHGSVLHNHCVKCNKYFNLEYIKKHKGTVRCDECKGLVKPDVVLYGEGLNDEVVSEALHQIQAADLMIVGGTSLNVYPAAGLLRYAKRVLLINMSKTSKDIFCDYVYYGKFAETCEKLKTLTK